ncbi:MAG TPA: sulfotransferase domain-containing protein [Methylocella sp.]|nr:sulfotransferase domain-containing protein [Methylocella sp.]
MNRLVSLSGRLLGKKISDSPSPEKFAPDPARDIFLVTYPRSGTTWISCVAAGLMFRISPDSLTEIDSIVPDVHALPAKSAVPPASCYLVKSHLPFNLALPSASYRRVIYLVRDPRDVLLSYHRYSQFLSHYEGGLKEFAMDWVAGRIWPCSWQEHVHSWLAPRSPAADFDLSVFHYEDFITDPKGQIRALAQALGVDTDEAWIGEIVSDTSAQAMRMRESRGKNGIGPEFQFIGAAKAESWKERLTGEDYDAISMVEEFTRGAMLRAGYAAAPRP